MENKHKDYKNIIQPKASKQTKDLKIFLLLKIKHVTHGKHKYKYLN